MKISLTKTVAVAAAAVVVLAVAGCKDDSPSSRVFVKTGTGLGPRIAVVPFDAVGNVRSQDAGRVVTSTVITYLLSTGLFDIVDPGELDEMLVSNQIRVTEGLRKTDLDALQKALNLDGVILGLVEEFGDVRVGNDTYPSIAFSARLINARTGGIVWAGTISKTGADKVTVFDIGRVSSISKLCKAAVEDMAKSMAKSFNEVRVALAPGESTQSVTVASSHGTESPVTPATPTHGSTSAPTAPTTPTVPTVPTGEATAAAGKSADEAKTYAEAELRSLIPDVPGYAKVEFGYRKHFHDTIEGSYTFAEGKQSVQVKLVDYQKIARAERFVRMYHTDEQPARFAGLPAFIRNGDCGYESIDLAVGRFGLFVKGPSARKDDVEKVAAVLVAAVR